MLKVMIAEDDLVMADMLEELLVDGGYEVCGIARTVDQAVKLDEEHQPELAILDVRLAGGNLGTDVSARLKRRGRPGILYATGNSSQVGLTKADGIAIIRKPYRPVDIVRALEIVEKVVSTGTASPPFPEGFHLLPPSSIDETAPGFRNGDATKHVNRLLRQQAALAAFGSFALGESDLEKILMEAARVCAEGFEVPFCKVCRYRPEENDLLVEAGVGWHQGVVGCVVSRADESSPQGRAFITGEPVICDDLSKDAVFVLPSFYTEHGIVSTLDVIIRKEGKPYGVLEIDSPTQRDFDQHDINFLTGFANVLAEAVNTSKRNAVLQSTADRMKDMVADRDRLLAAKNLILDEKNRLLDEKSVLAAELQHRVRNNLQLVYAMLTKQLQTAADRAGREGISAIARRVMTLAKVYDHLLGTGLGRTIDFGAYLSSLCTSFAALEKEQHRDIGLMCHGESVILDLDTVTALGLAVAELISNSYVHAFPDGTGTISVSLRRDESASRATIVFADDGIGFRDEVDSKRHGVGLVKRLMEQVEGSAELHPGPGTEWRLKFPVPTTQSADEDGLAE